MTTPHTSALSVLKQVFGYRTFRPGQESVIEHTLNGQDTLVLMPTGGGKSLCYQIPALLLPGLTIVVSPLISLMRDQVDALKVAGVAAELLNSSQPKEQQIAVLNALHEARIKILYVAPERLMQADFLHRVQEWDVQLFAIDEAHCVSHWGHDFRKEYCQLGQLKQLFPAIPVMGLTATADLATRRDILIQLGLQNPFIYQGSFDRPNIRYSQLLKFKPQEQLQKYIATQEGSGIVYCNSRRKVDDVAAKLAAQGINCMAYHAGMESDMREYVQRAFIQDRIDVVVATVAFGMGINKPDVRFVVHVDLPRSIESYYQETGRAGRDGLPAEALLLFDEKDVAKIRQWISENDNPERQAVELQRFAAMHALAEAQTCRRQVLLNYFGEYNAKACGNCDICLDPPRQFDGSEIAQKVLSCVYRLKQTSGSDYVVDILRGKKLAHIVDAGHDQLTTFGIGHDSPDAYWHNVINQLIHQGLLRVDITQRAVLKLTEAARPVLKGEQPVTLAVPRLTMDWQQRAKPERRFYDKRLYARLKHKRKQIAERDAVPPYVVFSDQTLMELADVTPESLTEMLAIYGIGQTKLERYGQEFLDAIQTYLAEG